MLAIHDTPDGFSPRWVDYCNERKIPYRRVNCFNTDIVAALEGVTGLMWHWHHWNYAAALFARQLSHSLERRGIAMFPNTATAWHYDDKVGQKYLLEAVGAPLVPSVVFYDAAEAKAWAACAAFPQVFKLRGGAGSENVRLANTQRQATRFIARSFNQGWTAHSRYHPLKERLWHLRRDRDLTSLINVGRGLIRAFVQHPNLQIAPVEKGYAYFQEFVPNNSHDIRVIVIGKRAFGIKRMIRRGDFRASGSGVLIYDPKAIPIECIDIAFQTSRRLQSQCLAYDFVFRDRQPLIVEISYAFAVRAYEACPGWWDDELRWHEAQFHPSDFMIEDFLQSIGHA